MQLTKEHLDQALSGIRVDVSTVKADVSAVKTGISNFATQDSLNELVKTVSEIKKTLEVHTTALDTLLKAHKIKKDENIISAERFTHIELWAKQVGEKLGIKLEL